MKIADRRSLRIHYCCRTGLSSSSSSSCAQELNGKLCNSLMDKLVVTFNKYIQYACILNIDKLNAQFSFFYPFFVTCVFVCVHVQYLTVVESVSDRDL